ncbi:MAG: hypothetical protein ABEJ88_10285 [Halobacterium sp.]
MSVSGLCSICENAQARFTCDRCGAVVCQAHYDADTGFCTECAAEVRRGREDATGGRDDVTGGRGGPR